MRSPRPLGRRWLQVILAVLLSIAAAGAEPGFVLMMADDLGWGDLGCYNPDSPIRTPHLDAMARSGARFERFYAASAVCSPTRASFLTGRHPERVGVKSANQGHLPAEEITIQRVLKNAGYRTGHFGKWHLGTLSKTVKESNRGGPKNARHFAPPWERDFETCFSTEAKVPTWDPMWRPKQAETRGNWWTPVEDTAQADRYGTHYWNEQGEMVEENLRGDDSRVIVDRAIPFIESCVEAGKPFLAVIWFHAPHLPVVTGGQLAERYQELDGDRRSYYGCVDGIDVQVGRLRAALRKLGVAENTVVTFCADNGPEGNSKAPGQTNGLRGRKRDLYEGGVRVPGLLEWPAMVRPGTVVRTPAFTSDYFPTVLAAAGLSCPAERPLDGVDVLPFVKAGAGRRGKALGFKFGTKAAWMDDGWKIHRKAGGSAWELYHLVEDPSEEKDLSADHKDRVRSMARQWETWWEGVQKSANGEDY